MQAAISKKQLIVTILEELFLAVMVTFVTVFITYLVVFGVMILVSGSMTKPVLLLRLSMPIGIAFALVTSYRHAVTRTNAKSRVRQVYAITGLLIVSAFIFSWYEIYRAKLLIKNVCTQFDQAIEQRDYETAYEFMSPSYRQTHTIARFIEDDSWFWRNYEPCNKDYIVEVYIGAREAGIVPYPRASLIHKIILEQANGKWYFTGESRYFQG